MQFVCRVFIALTGVALLLAIAEARTGRLQSFQTQRQFCQTQTVDANAYAQMDGLDLVLPAPMPVLTPPASLTPVVEGDRPNHPSRLDEFHSYIRPPPGV